VLATKGAGWVEDPDGPRCDAWHCGDIIIALVWVLSPAAFTAEPMPNKPLACLTPTTATSLSSGRRVCSTTQCSHLVAQTTCASNSNIVLACSRLGIAGWEAPAPVGGAGQDWPA
jgi:hypothetical protein